MKSVWIEWIGEGLGTNRKVNAGIWVIGVIARNNRDWLTNPLAGLPSEWRYTK